MHHYVWVKNLSLLVTNGHEHAHYVCVSYLQAFTIRHMLEQHKPNCLAHAPQQCIYPSPEKATFHFESYHYEFPFDFYLVADLYCFLRSPSADKPNVDAHHVPLDHVPLGFCVYLVTDHEGYRMDPSYIRKKTSW